MRTRFARSALAREDRGPQHEERLDPQFGSLSSSLAPDEDWTVPTTVAQAEVGLWTLTGNKALEPKW